MIKKTAGKPFPFCFKGKEHIGCIVEEQYEDEPISDAICDAIGDFYNLMHLIRKSWTNKKYVLIMHEAGYNIFDKHDELHQELLAWIGVKEKSEYLMFIPFRGMLYAKAQKYSKGPMVVLDFYEDAWVYSELKISNISKETEFKSQKRIISQWIKENIKPIL
jgi:hypothetical protein